MDLDDLDMERYQKNNSKAHPEKTADIVDNLEAKRVSEVDVGANTEKMGNIFYTGHSQEENGTNFLQGPSYSFGVGLTDPTFKKMTGVNDFIESIESKNSTKMPMIDDGGVEGK